MTSLLDRPLPAASISSAQGGDPVGVPMHLRAAIAGGFEVRVQDDSINIEAELAPIMRNPRIGAVVSFVGVVGQSGDIDDVVALEIEHYPGMTEQSLWHTVEEATARWRLEALKIVHRVGHVALGQTVLLVVVAARHRSTSFDACEFVMDVLKTQAPLWKKEVRNDGSCQWVEPKSRDDQAMERWG